MLKGTFKFVLAAVVFIVIGIVINPALAALFNGYQLGSVGVFLCSLLAAGLVIGSK